MGGDGGAVSADGVRRPGAGRATVVKGNSSEAGGQDMGSRGDDVDMGGGGGAVGGGGSDGGEWVDDTSNGAPTDLPVGCGSKEEKA